MAAAHRNGTFDLLGNLHGSFDAAYRDELIERVRPGPRQAHARVLDRNRQKVALIAAFMTRADVLIFDEPTSGLDPLRKVVFRECLVEAKERGQTIFLSSHLLIEVEESADRVGLLRRGKLVEVGTFAELRHLSAMRIEATFDGAPPDVSGVAGVDAVQVQDTCSPVTSTARSRRSSTCSPLRGRSISRAASRRSRTSSWRMATATEPRPPRSSSDASRSPASPAAR